MIIYLSSTIFVDNDKNFINLIKNDKNGECMMLNINFDEKKVEKIFIDELKKRLVHLENRQVFWDMKTLCKVTCMSENFIKEQFFYDSRFPKYRVGRKWLFPAKETEEFLINWLKGHPQA